MFLLSRLVGCGGDDASTSDGGDAGGGDVDGSVLEGGLPPGCDGTKDPSEASCQVVDEVGIFVDSAGGAGDGTKGKPVTTIAKGIELAKVANKGRVYVCKGTYAEAVLLDASKDGVSIYGGFKCSDWSYAKEATLITPAAVGFALTIKRTAAAITIADLEFRAKAAEADGESSIAGFVSDASSVTLKRVKLVAAAGKDGKSGAAVADFAGRAPDGISVVGTTPGGPSTNTCTTGNSVGGQGGGNNQGGGTGTPMGLPEVPPLATGTGGDTAQSCGAGGAHDGAYGVAGGPGSGAAEAHLTATGWATGNGTAGGNGGTAQGGGGGAGKAGYGGGGGAGGCGGLGGNPGTGGGSSIALASYRSGVSLAGCTLVAENGRDGGKGANGQKGQLGSANIGNPLSGGCGGALGGHGGSGGGGGGGAGGSSIGIAYQGTAPTLDGAPVADAATFAGVTIGSAGGKGLKGTGGPATQTAAPASNPGLDGTDGVAGVAKAVSAVP